MNARLSVSVLAVSLFLSPAAFAQNGAAGSEPSMSNTYGTSGSGMSRNCDAMSSGGTRTNCNNMSSGGMSNNMNDNRTNGSVPSTSSPSGATRY